MSEILTKGELITKLIRKISSSILCHMNRKKRIGLICGGVSPEHDVSVKSCQRILDHLDLNLYEPILIHIDREGTWHCHGKPIPNLVALLSEIDIAFPVLHGPCGEDGAIQGMLRMLNIPFVGDDLLPNAICMDKDVTKRLLNHAGLPCPHFHTITGRNSLKDLEITYPCFVKPANMGSSIGISKVYREGELVGAVEKAFEYDNKVLIEEYIEGDEVECALLGGNPPRVSSPSRLIPTHDFYSFEAKCYYPHGAESEVVAPYSEELVHAIQQMALKAYQVVGCVAMARVDMFVTREGKIYLNEINTIPGFTATSLYPQMWEASGLPFKELLNELISLGFKAFCERSSKPISSYGLVT